MEFNLSLTSPELGSLQEHQKSSKLLLHIKKEFDDHVIVETKLSSKLIKRQSCHHIETS